MAAQMRANKVGLAALKRALKTGASPGEAMVYGLLSTHAKDALATATRTATAGLGKAVGDHLTGPQRARLRDLAADELVRHGGGLLKNLDAEVRERVVNRVLDQFFRSQGADAR
ncbi:MAG: hypothetical protein H6907_04620 [Hyphomicrobiales bacterium]|nr:hypothetical protein [Hyphomicrobiales bacterium]MCP5370997.1 hypothetical protein [Hyphomicrobiales bacterium]